MDPRAEAWKKEYGKEKFPTEVLHGKQVHNMHITLNPQNFPDFVPDFVKEALGKIKVPLDPGEPEFTGGSLVSPKVGGGHSRLHSNDNYTYQVRMDALLSALNKVDPEAVKWFKSQYYSGLTSFIFTNEQVESPVD
ncbi:hypothetical protein A3A95_02375 [Candidatus Nomurabacteria bacterium RIFCSPLOWO2_01_FULL_39_18]|uniref:Uncharacterized protein n=1 Tax=Candidatus Nomurabacteria bacterium RIFCSPHIGHO2_01_FULL_40_24b TaxID=1801739 RepID=A0A1F6V5T3_9BACT|nr:MAG: hypothetical protein A2647_02130 [Candidatus Nomurabacteria bacterium RIFCSPHIGHO2_01_FULL_40_24b]OGI90705.1 MAG: hypothetical protein A3A95_02375 [Candidatus Nomurabacteria bacterium RIFCSPLOWO2_01_FULL_39_18]